MSESGETVGSDLRLAVIGAGPGHTTSRIYPCFSRLPVDLVAVCDLDSSRAESNARKFGARSSYTDFRKMLEEVEPGAVIISIGPEQHSKLASEVMEFGLPVFTEKPPSVSASEARGMLDTSRRTGRTCMTGFCKRFAPGYQAAWSAIEAPSFGTPQLLTVEWSLGPAVYTSLPDVPRFDFLLDFGIHAIDAVRYLAGEVTDVYARRRPDDGTWAVSLSLANGGIGVMSMTDHRSALAERVEVVGEDGNTVTISHAGSMVHSRGVEVRGKYEQAFAIADSLVENGYQGELAEFVDSVREGREPESSIASAYETMRVYEAIVRSADENRIVAVDEVS